MSKKRSTSTRRAETQAAAARAAVIREEQERRERRRRSLVVTGVVVVVLAVILVVFTALQSRRDDSTSASSAAPAGAVAGLAVPAGRASAPVTVTVYEDFMCPFCGDFESASRAAFAEDIAEGKVRFEYHVLSFLDDASSTEYSTRAANALGVVLDSSGAAVAKRFHDLLFENQPAENSAGLSDDRLVDLAVESGAKESAVRSGIDGLAFEGWVEKVTEDASKAEVNSTPTVKVDGRTVTFETTDELVAEVRKAVDAGQ
jgi:protein-disulfide isomerase